MGKDKRKSEGEGSEDKEAKWNELLQHISPIANPLATRKLTKKLYKCIKKGTIFWDTSVDASLGETSRRGSSSEVTIPRAILLTNCCDRQRVDYRLCTLTRHTNVSEQQCLAEANVPLYQPAAPTLRINSLCVRVQTVRNLSALWADRGRS